MIAEDYVSSEIAKLLKKKGFDIACEHQYINCSSGYPFLTSIRDDAGNYYKNSEIGNDEYSAPTLAMAMKWLREVHGLHISLEPCYDYDSMHVVFLAFVQNVADVHEFMDGRKNVASHSNAEKSYELAIKYCLENLI